MTYDPRYYATLSELRDAIDRAIFYCGAVDTVDALRNATAEIDANPTPADIERLARERLDAQRIATD